MLSEEFEWASVVFHFIFPLHILMPSSQTRNRTHLQ
uniref:Uncharacterized protein n=1 Tax=Anguilla anguilla TaxID=7936 RepID=A0A0E9UNT6_ANGAN